MTFIVKVFFLIATISCFYLASVTQTPAKHYFFVLAIWFIYMFINNRLAKNNAQNIKFLSMLVDIFIAFIPLVSYFLFQQFHEYSRWLVIILLILISGNLLLKIQISKSSGGI